MSLCLSSPRQRVAGAILFLASCGASCGVIQAEPGPQFDCGQDSRCHALRNFFLAHQSPLSEKALIFLKAADEHKLDWRLLPSISMVETSGGKHCVGHNIFGWNSGRAHFPSVDYAIQHVASRFSASPIYAGRTALGILNRFNPNRQAYPPKVVGFMRKLSPDPID